MESKQSLRAERRNPGERCPKVAITTRSKRAAPGNPTIGNQVDLCFRKSEFCGIVAS